MAQRTITINPKDDVVAVIHEIKASKERDLLIVMKKGANVLYSSENLRLFRKTGEVLGKKIRVSVDANDEIGLQIAKKAGMLDGEEVKAESVNPKFSRIKRGDILRPVGDIKARRAKLESSKVTKVVKTSMRPESVTNKDEKHDSILTEISDKLALKKKISLIPKIETRSFGKKFSSNFALRIFFTGLAVLVVGTLLVSVFLPSAQVTIYARSEPVSRDVDVTVDQNATTVDVEKMVVHGIPVSKEIAKTKTFATTGVQLDGVKTKGLVRLYNFTTNTLTLKQSTTTLVANGKNFYFASDVTGLKPTKRKGADPDSDVDPSSLVSEIEIIAENPGETYNMPAGTKFTIVNTALGNRDVYAMNEQALGGGQATAAPMLSAEDIDQATSQILKEIFEDLENEISLEQSGQVRILTLDGVEILAKTPNKNVGDVVESFDMTVIARVTGLAYKEAEINSLLQEKITNILSADKYLVENARKNITIKEKTYDKVKGVGTIGVHYETTVAYKINTASLSKVLTGKTESEIKEILLTKPEVDQVKVDFSPFFVHKSPRFTNKIDLITEISE